MYMYVLVAVIFNIWYKVIFTYTAVFQLFKLSLPEAFIGKAL